ncbi:MAG: hypothetical protein EOO41_00590, partial [Methanobacteriota archaeon]
MYFALACLLPRLQRRCWARDDAGVVAAWRVFLNEHTVEELLSVIEAPVALVEVLSNLCSCDVPLGAGLPPLLQSVCVLVDALAQVCASEEESNGSSTSHMLLLLQNFVSMGILPQDAADALSSVLRATDSSDAGAVVEGDDTQLTAAERTMALAHRLRRVLSTSLIEYAHHGDGRALSTKLQSFGRVALCLLPLLEVLEEEEEGEEERKETAALADATAVSAEAPAVHAHASTENSHASARDVSQELDDDVDDASERLSFNLDRELQAHMQSLDVGADDVHQQLDDEVDDASERNSFNLDRELQAHMRDLDAREAEGGGESADEYDYEEDEDEEGDGYNVEE